MERTLRAVVTTGADLVRDIPRLYGGLQVNVIRCLCPKRLWGFDGLSRLPMIHHYGDCPLFEDTSTGEREREPSDPAGL
jgi:hypothetical protein